MTKDVSFIDAAESLLGKFMAPFLFRKPLAKRFAYDPALRAVHALRNFVETGHQVCRQLRRHYPFVTTRHVVQ